MALSGIMAPNKKEKKIRYHYYTIYYLGQSKRILVMLFYIVTVSEVKLGINIVETYSQTLNLPN